MSRVQVLGVGSPFGDDRVGWAVADALLARPCAGVPALEVHRLDRPGPALLSQLRGAGRAVIVDALRGGPPGAVQVLDSSALGNACTALSGHALGVAGSLALLAALGEQPAALRVVAVSIADARGFAMSDAVAAAVPRAAALVERLAARM